MFFAKSEMRVIEACNRMNGPCGIKCFSRHKESEGWDLVPEADIQQVGVMYQKQLEAGIGAVNVVGGEALLKKDIVPVLEMGRAAGFKMVLTTNCDFMTFELMNKIAPSIDFLSISVDGDRGSLHDDLRGQGQFQRVSQVIADFNPDRFPFRLKVNTVVSAKNITPGLGLDGIGVMLDGKNAIWKLIQFTPRGQGYLAKKDYEITREAFELRVAEIQRQNPGIYICSRVYRYDDPPDVLIIRPNGDLVINYQYQHLRVGNLFEEAINEVVARVQEEHPEYIRGNVEEYKNSYPNEIKDFG